MIQNTLIKIIKKSSSLNHKQIHLNLYSKYYQFSTSTATPKQEYNKKFLVRMNFKQSSDAYYQTYPYRQEFRKQIKQLQDSNKCYLFGGDLFPMEGSLFLINCDDKVTVEDFFMNKNIYAKNNLVKNVQIEQVQQISDQKIKKLTYFYQYK